MAKIITKNGEIVRYPASVNSVKKMFSVSVPRKGVMPMALPDGHKFEECRVVIPFYDTRTQIVRGAVPVLANGEWVEARTISDKPIDEVLADMQATVTDATQKRMDDYAVEHGYDSILSLCSYATSPTFSAEGQHGINVRDATWAALVAILGDIAAGNRAPPESYADIEPDLPELVWPV
jgi:hypothetical protein